MKLVFRTDLGGRAVGLPAAEALAEIPIKKSMVILAGGNGAGKSSMIAALRQATGLVGPGIGKFRKHELFDEPLSFPSHWGTTSKPLVDLARHALLVQDGLSSFGNRSAKTPENTVGVLDPVKLGWIGQRVWLHDGRKIDNIDSLRGDMNTSSMRRAGDDRVRSHGEQMTGRLRYAVAWALGYFDLKDPYDSPEPETESSQVVPREIFARLAGHRPNDPTRTNEKWLLLDEPETGIDPAVFLTLMATLADAATPGRLRVICATHSPLAFDIGKHCGVQMIDIDGYAARLLDARRMLADPVTRKTAVEAEAARLRADTVSAIATDRGLAGQSRFTAHEAESVPYPNAIVAPYGKPECLSMMRCAVEEVDLDLPYTLGR